MGVRLIVHAEGFVLVVVLAACWRLHGQEDARAR
jgi:hypothetical protein